MTADSDRFQIIGELLDEFMAQLRAGVQPDVETYARRRPELADQIRAALSAILIVEKPESTKSNRVEAPESSLPESIGDFKIVRELGRGGMGRVFEAVQKSLDRRVALKVLDWQHGETDEQKSRFSVEAQAAARLHHTNIVPVFQVGQADGHFYYAMQMIEGASLDRIICALQEFGVYESKLYGSPGKTPEQNRTSFNTDPTVRNQLDVQVHSGDLNQPHTKDIAKQTDPNAIPKISSMPASSGRKPESQLTSDSSSLDVATRDYFQSVAGIIRQAAEGLHYAHSNHILHRDIKPANLILDGNGTTWLTDFGLAKVRDTDLTKTGQIVGTLRYLAPERLKGVEDHRADIYALGLTAFELATLQPAFEDHDQASLVGRIMNESVADPRSVCQEIPLDLAMVIRKATAREPDLRYQSAEAMADDLKRFQQGRPIAARQASTWTRVRFWSKRNPLAATLCSTIALLLLIAGIGSSVVALSLNEKNIEINQRLQTEKQLRLDSDIQLIDMSLATYHSLANSNQVGRSQQRFESIDSLILLSKKHPDQCPNNLTIRNMLLETESMFDLMMKHAIPVKDENLYRQDKWDFSSNLHWIAKIENGQLLLQSVVDDDVEETESRNWRYGRTLFGDSDRYVAVYGLDANQNCRVEVWDRLQKVIVFSGNGNVTGGLGNRCSFNQDGTRFAWLDEHQNVSVASLPDNKPIWNSNNLDAEVDWVCLEPSGDSILFNQGNFVFQYDFALEIVTRKFQLSGFSTACTWSNRPGIFAVACDTGTVYVWNSNNSSAPVETCQGHRGHISHLTFHPDGETLGVVCRDGSTHFWKKGNMNLIAPFGATRFSQDGQEIGFWDPLDSLSIWDVQGKFRQELACSISPEIGPTFELSVLANDRILAWSGNQPFLSLCDISDDPGPNKFQAITGDWYSSTNTVVSREQGNAEILVGAVDSIWSIEIDETKQDLSPSTPVKKETFVAAGQKLFKVRENLQVRTESANGFRVLASGQQTAHYPTDSWTGAVDICEKRSLAAITSKSQPLVSLFSTSEMNDLETCQPLLAHVMKDDSKRHCPNFSTDGRTLLLSCQGGFYVTKLSDDSETPSLTLTVTQFVPVTQSIFSRTAWSNDDKFVAASSENSVTIFRSDTWEKVVELNAPQGCRFAGETLDSSADIQFLQNDRVIVCGTWANSVVVWDIEGMRESLRVRGFNW